MVIVFGDGFGGDLCFHKIGLCFPVLPGDVIPFMSGWLTHFNMPFEGCRLSFANYTESAMEAWGDDNNWKGFFGSGPMPDVTLNPGPSTGG
jgi:hypothetical protein